MSELEFKRDKPNLFSAYKDGELIAYANYNIRGNYIDTLFVKTEFRRQGVGSALVNFIVETNGRKLLRCPDHLKNDAVRGLSVKFGDRIGREARAK